MIFFSGLVFFTLLCGNVLAVEIDLTNCSVPLDVADKSAKVLTVIGDRNAYIIKEDKPGVDIHCQLMRDNLKVLKEHSRCYTAFPKQVFGILLKSFSKAIKKRCRKGIDREKFVKYSLMCIPNHESVENVHRCMDKTYVMADYLRENMKLEQQLSVGCCGYEMTKECVYKEALNVCGNSTNDEAAKFLMSIVEDSVGGAFGLICNGLNSMELCNKKLPDEVAKLREVSENATRVDKSIFFPLANIAIRLTENDEKILDKIEIS